MMPLVCYEDLRRRIFSIVQMYWCLKLCVGIGEAAQWRTWPHVSLFSALETYSTIQFFSLLWTQTFVCSFHFSSPNEEKSKALEKEMTTILNFIHWKVQMLQMLCLGQACFFSVSEGDFTNCISCKAAGSNWTVTCGHCLSTIAAYDWPGAIQTAMKMFIAMVR